MLRDQFPLNIRDPRAKDKLIMEAQNNPRLLTFDRAVSIVKTCDSLNVRKDEEEMEVDLLKKQQIKKKPCSYCGQTHLPDSAQRMVNCAPNVGRGVILRQCVK